MGLKQSIISNVCSFHQDQWQKTTIKTYTNIKDPFYGSNFQVFTNKLNNHLQIEKYNLIFTSYKEYQVYKEVIDWRNSNRNLISSKYIKSISQQNICADMHYSSIFIERMPIRLFEIGDIELQEALCILYSSIQAFTFLYQKFGYFVIQSDMICFTKEGYVKSCANKNLSKVYPQIYHQGNKSYAQFMQSLLCMIQGLIDYEGRMSISRFIQKKKINLPFLDLLKVIQFYVKQNNIIIPRYLKSIRSLCHKNIKSALSNRHSHENISMKQTTNKTLRQYKMQNNIKTQHLFNNNQYDKHNTIIHNQIKQKQKIHNLFIANGNNNTHRPLNISFQYNGFNMNQSKRNVKTSMENDNSRKTKMFSEIIVPKIINRYSVRQKGRYLSNNYEYQIDPEIEQDLLKLSQTIN